MSSDRDEAFSQACDIVQKGRVTHCIVGGGDGTVADIASLLIGTSIVMGILPIGTANVLAHELGVPEDDAKNVQQLLCGTSRALWPGIAVFSDRQEMFVQMAGVGFDGAIVKAVSLRIKRWIGRYAYGVSALWAVLDYRAPSFEVTLDGTPHRVVSIIVSKGRFYGGAYQIAPHSQMSVPFFNVILLKKRGFKALLQVVRQVLCHQTMAVLGVSEHHVAQEVHIQDYVSIPTQTDGDARLGCPRAFHGTQHPLYVGYGVQ